MIPFYYSYGEPSVEFLNEVGAKIVENRHSLIVAEASVGTWERALRTEFFYLRSKSEQKRIARARKYYLPESVASNVASVLQSTQIPATINRRPNRHSSEL